MRYSVMKKRAIYYLGWDVLLFLYIYCYSLIESQMRISFNQSWDFTQSVLLKPILIGFAGVLFGILALYNCKGNISFKEAVIELVMVGIPSLYLASITALPFLICMVMGSTEIQYDIPQMLLRSQFPMTLGAILFGYEILIFIFRWIQMTKDAKDINMLDPENERCQ